MEKDYALFGSNVRQHRIWRGWSVRELAEKSGVSARTINRIEKGEPFHESAELKICRAFTVTLGTLWRVDLNQRGNRNVVRSDQ